MKILYILQSSILEDIPWWTWLGGAIIFVGLLIWRYLRRKYPSLGKIERFFDDFNRNEAVSTSINDAYPRAEVEDFPPHPVSEEIKNKLTKSGEVTLGPGIYDFYLQSFCIGAGKYAPTTGSGYLIAPLIKGTKSSIIKNILKNSIKQLVSQQTIQTLIWSLESGMKYDEMPSNLQSTMDRLLNKEEIQSLRKSFWEKIPKGILNLILAGVKSKLPQEMLEMFNAYNTIKELILDPNMSYENLISTAVRYGEPSPSENMIKIESGEWCETPEGYFIRALTRDNFSRLRIQISVPEGNASPHNNPGLHNPGTEDTNIAFDPSKIIAVPANTNKQRLGLRPREEEEEEEKPCVIILEPDLITFKEYVPCDGSYEPHISAIAPGGGSNYNWTFIQGTERASFSGSTTNRMVIIRLFAPSITLDDITIRVSYLDTDGQLKQCSKSFSVLQPRKLQIITDNNLPIKEIDGIWYIGVERQYQVLDQFDQPLRTHKLKVTETLTGFDVEANEISWNSGTRDLSYNPGMISTVGPGVAKVKMEAHSTITDVEGRFDDTPKIWSSSSFPDETDFIIFQEIQVEGCIVRKNTIHFLNDSADIAP